MLCCKLLADKHPSQPRVALHTTPAASLSSPCTDRSSPARFPARLLACPRRVIDHPGCSPVSLIGTTSSLKCTIACIGTLPYDSFSEPCLRNPASDRLSSDRIQSWSPVFGTLPYDGFTRTPSEPPVPGAPPDRRAASVELSIVPPALRFTNHSIADIGTHSDARSAIRP